MIPRVGGDFGQSMKGDIIDRGGLADAVRRQTYGAAMKLFPRCLMAEATSRRAI